MKPIAVPLTHGWIGIANAYHGRDAATFAGDHMVLPAFAIFALAWTGIALTRGNDRIAAVWLANAVALAIILRHPKAHWGALVASAWLANLSANILSGDSWWFASVLSFANAAEIVVAASLVSRVFKPHDRFDSCYQPAGRTVDSNAGVGMHVQIRLPVRHRLDG